MYNNKLFYIVNNENNISNIVNMSNSELESIFGNRFAKMKDFSQNNPHHCYDLLNHSVKCCLNLDISQIREEKINYARIACLYHDIGKLETKAINPKTGFDCFYGHAYAGVPIAREFFTKINLPKADISYMLFLIGNHDIFMNYKLEDEMTSSKYDVCINKNNIMNLIHNVKTKEKDIYNCELTIEDFKELCQVALADVKSQSEKTFINNRLVITKEIKVKRLESILEIINSL